MTGKHISAYSGIHRIKQKPQTPGHISAYTGVQRIKREEEATDKGGLLGSVEYVGGRFALGAGQMAEGITDTALAAVHLARLNPEAAAQVYKDNVTGDLSERLQEAHNPGTVTQLAGDVASGIGTSLMYMIPKAGIFLGAAGTFGSNVSEAAEKTGEVGLKELGYAATATVPEVALEGLIGAGVRGGKALFSAGSKALTKGAAKAGVKTVGKTATKVSKSLLGHVALETAKGMAGEGAEEAITEAIDPFLLRLFKIDENAQLDMGNVLYAGLIGSLSGGLMTSGPAAINYKSSQAAGRMIREAGLTDAFLEETRELLGGADRAKTKAEAAKGEKVNAEEGSGVIGKVTAMGKNTVNTVRQSKIASSAKRIAETTRKNLQSFEQFNAKENKTAQEQAIADAMLGELRGNVYLLETSYLSETYEQAILDATPEQKQDIVDFINKSMAAKNAAKSDYTVADLDADTDGILTSMAAKYVEGDLEKYMGIRRVDSMEGRGKKDTETAEEAATSPWSGLADGEDMSGYKAAGEAENALLKAAVNQGVPRGSVPAMLEQFRKGTKLTPAEFAEGWADGAHKYGRYGFDASKDGDTVFNRMEPEAREAAMKFGRETEEAERKTREEKAKAKKKPAAQAGKKGTVVRGEGLNVQKLSDEQYAAYKAAEVLAEVLGTEIVIENRITDKAGRTVNGYYDTKTNRLHVNINAMRDGKNISLYTLGHEVTHYIKEWSPAKFEALADFVLDQMGVDAETAVADKLASLKRLGIVTDTMTIAEANAIAREELVAEGMELVLTDGKVLEELSKTDKTLWEKIRDWFFDIIGQIRQSWQDLNQASKTAQVLKETVESLEEIERLFTEGVREAGERTRTAGVGSQYVDTIRFSLMNEFSLEENVDRVMEMDDETAKNNKAADQYVSIMPATPDIITQNVKDAENLEIVMRFDSFYLATRHEGALEGHYHNYGEIMKKLPEIISDPEAIVRMDNGRLNLLAMVETKKGKYSVVSIELNTVKDINSKNTKYNLVVSVVPAKDNYMRNNLMNHGVKVEYQKEDLPQVNHQLYEWLATVNDKSSGDSITQPDSSVNTSTENSSENIYDTEDGVMIDPASGTAMLSVDDIPKTEQEIDDAVNRLVKKLGVDESRARQWVQNELSLATLILRDDMVDYAHRKADRRLTAIVKNSDYKQGTLDFSNICRKRREYTRMMQRIQQAFPNRRFTAEEFATIRKIMVDEGLEVACGLCYVEDRRQNEGYIAETFQRAVEAWRKGNRDTYYDTKNNVESAYNKGQTKAMALLEGGDYVPTIADLTTVEGMENLQREHPDILRAWRGFNNARGMASARLLTGEAEYQRQILKYSKARVKQINDLGGLRVFSFSDFEEFHLIDIIQAVQDCAAMGIKIQFYTKVPSFALLMKDTKAKGNLSLIPKGDLGYVMMNGKPVLAYDPVEGIDFNDPAFKKVVRGNPNIGTILVGINDTQIRAAMADNYIDYIIPFHSGQSEVVRQIKKIGKWQNYKNEQVDKPWESGSKAKPVNVYTDVIAAAEREGNPIRNERQFVERFLNVCEERGLRPRFSRFLNTNAEGKYVYTKGYYKLLLDFKMFDKDGTYLPQEAVIPEFDADLLHELTEKYVAGEKAKTEAESPAFQRALERVEAEVVGDDEGRMYSIDETPETPDVSENATDTNVGGTEEELTDRDMLLAMAERLVGNEKENEILTRYKEQHEAQLRREDKLDSIYDEVDEQRGILYTDPDAAKRSAAAKRLKELFKDVDKISSEIAEVDRELTKIAGMKIMRNLIVRERKTSKKFYQEWYHQMYTRNKETRETTDMRRQVRRIYGRVSRLMFAPTRTKSVPYELKPAIAEALKMADMDGEAIARLGELEQQLARLEREAVRDEDKIAKKKREIENQEKKVGKMKEQTELMIKIFEKSKEIKDGVGAAVYDEGAMNLLKGLQAKMGNASIRNANKEQLQALKDFYDVMYHRINTANNTFASQRAENIDDIGSQSTEQVKTTKALKFLSPRAMELAGLAGVRGFFWKNMKPLTVFDALGSDKFRELFQKVLDGEIVWATDVEEASKVINETRAKYGHAKWKQDERVAVQTKDGEVKLSLAERMSLYAYFQRLQAMNHLEFGGFKLDPTATDMGKGRVIKFVDMKRSLNDAQAYRLDKELAGKISATLTAEQKAYVEEMQKYLTEMGKKGNEVSRKLYGMDIFTEEFYFPIKVVSDVLQSQTGKTGDPKIKNQGMTKELVQDAKEPMLLQGFDDVMVEHINNMATYHAFVLPVEDLTRVLNYKPANFKRDKDGNVILNDNGLPVSDPDAQKDFTSLKAVIQAKYGVDAVNYIEQLIRDLNGGARRDAAATILDKGLTAFKRAATTMSASTIIQQPTSVIRAMAYVDAKHFSGASITPWETVKKYAKVAFIKEMGGHDINTGARTQEFLNQREYENIGQKVKAAVTPEVYGGDPQARAEFFGWLTSKADEKTWCFLFSAVVNEQAERLGKPKDSEEVLKAAGERFTEVVRRTQVYDSTLTRSQYMRSKDGLMKMATSFMAEPTTVVSMAADAIIRLERGDKMFIRKTAAGIAGSIILNAMAVSLIYAMRDDDEEKNYLEKYISSLTGEIVEGLNPLEYFPILRDIMSLFKGYEIERSDMTLINNLLEQVELITSSKRSFMDKMIGVTGAVAAFFGIPVTNLYRDVKGLTTTTISLFNGEPMTAKGTASAALEGVTDQFGLFKKLLGGDRGTSYELYRAKVSGDNSHYTRVAARYDSPEAEEQALRRELRENDKRIGEAAEARRSGDIEVYKSLVEQITDEGIFDRGMVIRAIQTHMNALSRETEKGTVVPKDTEVADEETVEVVSLYSSSDLNAALERGDTEDFKEIYESMVSDRVKAGKTEAQAKSAVKSSITAYWKPRYIEARNANDTETMKKILQILLSSGLYGSRNDVAVMLEGWIKAYAKSK